MTFKCYINGEMVDGKGGNLKVINPGTEEVIGDVSLIDESQAEMALEAAEAGFKYWSSLTLVEREKWIRKLREAIIENREEIMDLLMQETGKLYGGADEDYQMLPDCLDYFIEEAKRLNGEIINDLNGNHQNLIIREPIGVVVGYLAWNFPLLNLGYKLGPVLASGCSCILKPSSSTPLATLKIAEIMHSIDFPKGVINFVLGDTSKLSNIFNKSKITKLITLIGSSATGKKIIEDSAASIKHFSLELGGNAPAIVLKDFDEKKAAEMLTGFKAANCGQVCVSPNRVFVHEDQYESYLEKALEVAKGIKPGWGTEEGAGISPLMTDRDRKRLIEIVDDAVAKGARLIHGGKAPATKDKGFYMEPTILADVTRDMRCYKEELFGPIMPVVKYDDNTDLVEAGNDTEYGLASYLFSHNVNEIFKISKGLKFGTVCVNEPHYSFNLPHGGVKESGIGKDCSRYSLEEYYYVKRITIAINN